MLRYVVIVILVLWLLGLVAKIGGGLIHLLLLVAVVVFIYDMIVSRKKA